MDRAPGFRGLANVETVSKKRTPGGGAESPNGPQPSARSAEELGLLTYIDAALAEPHPLAALIAASTLISIIDSRMPATASVDSSAPNLGGLVATLMEDSQPSSTALLAIFAELLGADQAFLRARIRRELRARPAAEPVWLGKLSEISPHRAARISHVLGDGDSILLAVTIPGGFEATCLVYIDHNLGTLVKDAFVVDRSIDDMIVGMREVSPDADLHIEDMSLADVRAWIEPAISMAARTFPPLETESWPACCAFVERCLRSLPPGGVPRARQQWSVDDRFGLADRFVNSDMGARFGGDDVRGLLDALLWFATDWGTGDPMRWSPVRVEILLADWGPRTLEGPMELLGRAPEVLRAFIPFAHTEIGIEPRLTREALVAVDDWEPFYQRGIRETLPSASEVLRGVVGGDRFDEAALESLARQVGGPAALNALGEEPLPDEPFRWENVPPDVAARVDEVLALVERCCERLFDVEFRTACRRLIAHVATQGPQFFRRKGRVELFAAAVVWLIGKVNDVFDLYFGLQVKDMMAEFGINQGGAGERSRQLLDAGGFETETYDLALGSPSYLVSSRRRQIIERRDDLQSRIGRMR